MSAEKKPTKTEMQAAIASEVIAFLQEYKEEILRRARKKLRAAGK